MSVTRARCAEQLLCPCRLLVLGLLALLAGVAVAAEEGAAPGALRIRVIDRDWDVPLADAQVNVLEANVRRASDKEGGVLFEALPVGTYTVVVSAQGFERRVLSKIAIVPGDVHVEEVRLGAEFTDMDEFVVKDLDFGAVGSDLQQLELRSQHGGLMDSVGADMMSKAGAGTAAAALRLVTGATVQDGKYAVIRGLGDRYTATLVNGVRMPTADKDKRAVHMDQFPSAMIESVQVTKTFMPDQQGDASGGINIITKSVPEGPVLKASVSTEYDTNATGEENFKTYAGGGNEFGGMRGVGSLRFWDSGSMDNPRGASSYSYQEYTEADPCAESPTLATSTKRTVNSADEKYSSAIESTAPPMNYGFKFAAGDSVSSGDWKFGGLLTGSYSQKYKYRTGVKQSYQQNASATNTLPLTGEGSKTYIETSTDEQLWSVGLSAGAKNENNEIRFTGLYTHQSTDVVETRYGGNTATTTTTNDLKQGRTVIGQRYNYDRSRTFSTVMQYTESANASTQLAGKHTLPWLNDAELDWTGAYNMAESIEPDRRSFTGGYLSQREVLDYNAGRPEEDSETSSSEIEINDYERRWQDTREDAWQGQANLKLPFTVFENEGYVKTGVFADYMKRKYRNRVYSVTATNTIPATDEYDYSNFGLLDNYALPESLNPKSIEYDGEQELTATYFMLKAPLPEWVELVGGARFESTIMDTTILSPVSDKITQYYLITEENATTEELKNSTGRIGYKTNVDPSEGDASINQLDVLPAVALNVRPLEDFSLRLAYSQTIARPTFKEITPVLYQDSDNSRVFLGNPDLTMSSLENFDARLEWHPAGTPDLIAIGAFYKTISDPIQYSTRRDTQAGATDYIYPENYGEGEIRGVEVELRKGLGFVWSGLQDFSVGGNLTLQESEVAYPDDIREKLIKANVYDETRPMDGQSDILANVNLLFDNEWSGLSVGVFYNLKGETYVSGDTATDDTYVPSIVEKPVGTFDVTVGLKFAKNWRLGLEFKNLLDPEIETVYRTPYRDIANTTYKSGRTYGLSLSCDW